MNESKNRNSSLMIKKEKMRRKQSKNFYENEKIIETTENTKRFKIDTVLNYAL
jgi:hypothetical protein